MNVYDSEKMSDLLEEKLKFFPTKEEKNADLLIVNTCSIREKAQKKIFDQLGRWKILKKNNPNIKIGVAGCLSSQEGSNIIKKAPYVDMVFGPQTLHRLPKMIQKVNQDNTSYVDISFPEIEKFDYLPKPRMKGVKAYVSIMEGCNKYCSYCIVPYTRGEEISRPFDDILAECSELAKQGVKEIILLGQNVNHYLGEMHTGDIADLSMLIYYVASIDNISRIRFMTSHPVEFSENLIQTYKEIPELCNHLHLPVQSGSDRILSAMKRNHTVLEFKSKIRKLRKVRPNISISTDIIVGFPGETEKDFLDTMNLVKEIGFDYSYTFIYSKRPGTPASQLLDKTSIETKKKRLSLLQTCISYQGMKISKNMVGTKQIILVDSISKKSCSEYSGRTENNRVVNFIGKSNLLGKFITVEITDALPNSLRGKYIQ